MKILKITICAFFFALPAHTVFADRTEIPKKYFDYGLIEDAKREFIAITIDRRADDEEKAISLSALGDIAFRERNITLALETWQELLETYPDSEQATMVTERIAQIGDIVDATTGDTLDNVVARSYIAHGDWWSREKEEKTTIDSSWIPKDEVAIGWYDRTIAEFPGTSAATLAMKKKFYTVHGWEDPGQYGEKYGVVRTGRVSDLVSVYDQLVIASPDDIDLQRFRYMIAQSYWQNRDFDKTREWLQKIIEADDGKNGFYKDLAEWRMKKVEY